MAHIAGIVQLHNLVDKWLNWLQLLFETGFFHFNQELTKINDGFLDTWEKIRDNILEQRQVILQELGHVDVHQRT